MHTMNRMQVLLNLHTIDVAQVPLARDTLPAPAEESLTVKNLFSPP